MLWQGKTRARSKLWWRMSITAVCRSHQASRTRGDEADKPTSAASAVALTRVRRLERRPADSRVIRAPTSQATLAPDVARSSIVYAQE